MNKAFYIVIIVGVFVTGCTSVHYYEHNMESYEKINQKTKRQPVEIRLSNGQTTKGYFFKATMDSMQWVETPLLNTNIVSTTSVDELYTKNRKRGAVIGFCVAAAIGALTGGALGVISDVLGDRQMDEESYGPKYALVGGLLCGVVVGLPIGAAVGGKNKFILHVSVDSIDKGGKKMLRKRRDR